MVAVTVEEALRRYGREVGPTKAAANVALVRRYLAQGGQNTDTSLTAYLRRMLRDGYAPSTVDLHRRTIRAFYGHLRMAAPRAKDVGFDPGDVDRPALDRPAVEAMVAAARTQGLPGWHVALLALSTTYGMRVEELASVQDQDIDREGARVYIRTVKKGQKRFCYLPPDIAAVMLEAWPRASTARATKAFAALWGAAFDAPKPDGVAWHAIRRALHRDLAEAGVPETDRIRFGRWKGAATMAGLYSRPNQTVGAQGVERARSEPEGAREYDAAVWSAHPYLALWS